MNGKAVLDENSHRLKSIWSTMKPESKICYMGPFSPGEILDHFQPNLPNHTAQNISTENNRRGYKNFCRVTIHFERTRLVATRLSRPQTNSFTFDKKF